VLPKLRALLKPKKPPNLDELFQQALSLHQQGQLERAIELYGQCVEQEPERGRKSITSGPTR